MTNTRALPVFSVAATRRHAVGRDATTLRSRPRQLSRQIANRGVDHVCRAEVGHFWRALRRERKTETDASYGMGGRILRNRTFKVSEASFGPPGPMPMLASVIDVPHESWIPRGVRCRGASVD